MLWFRQHREDSNLQSLWIIPIRKPPTWCFKTGNLHSTRKDKSVSWGFTRNKFWRSVHHYIFQVAIYFSRHNSTPYTSVSLRVSERPYNSLASVCFEHGWLHYHSMKPAHDKRFFHVVGYDMRFSASQWDDWCVFSQPVRRILFCIADVFRIKLPVNSSIKHF